MKKRQLLFFCFFFVNLFCSASVFSRETGHWRAGAFATQLRNNGHYTTDLVYGTTVLPATYQKETFRDTGNALGLFSGYEFVYRGWWLGLELSLAYQHAAHWLYFQFLDSVQWLQWQGAAQYKPGWELGLLGRAGYQMASFLLTYLRFGVETSRDSMSVVYQGPPSFPYISAVEEKHWQYRSVWGVGFEIPLVRCSRLGIEYNVHIPHYALSKMGVISDGILNPFFHTHAKPTTQAIKVFLAWNL